MDNIIREIKYIRKIEYFIACIEIIYLVIAYIILIRIQPQSLSIENVSTQLILGYVLLISVTFIIKKHLHNRQMHIQEVDRLISDSHWMKIVPYMLIIGVDSVFVLMALNGLYIYSFLIYLIFQGGMYLVNKDELYVNDTLFIKGNQTVFLDRVTRFRSDAYYTVYLHMEDGNYPVSFWSERKYNAFIEYLRCHVAVLEITD